MARNRKRAKERRARHPEAVVSARRQRDDAPPSPLAHAAPDVELAEAQLAMGRPELEPPDEAAGRNGAHADSGDAVDEVDTADAVDETEDYELEEEEEEEQAAAEGPVDRDVPELARHPHAATPEHQENLAARLITFLQGCWRELQRVQWPDRRQVWQATGVVIGFVIVCGLYLGLADEVASKVMTFVLK